MACITLWNTTLCYTEETKPKVYVQIGNYGGEKGGEIFAQRSKEAVNWAAQEIKTLIAKSAQEKKNLKDYFTDFLGDQSRGLAKFRSDIANETNTGAKERFGKVRNSTAYLLDFTPIRVSWHDDVVDYFKSLLQHLVGKNNDHIVHLKSPNSQNDLHVMNQDYSLDPHNISFSRTIMQQHYNYSPEELSDENVRLIADHEAVSLDALFFNPPNDTIKRELRMKQREKNIMKMLKYHTRIKIKDRMVPASAIYGFFQADPSVPNGISENSITTLSQKAFFLAMHTPKKDLPVLQEAAAELWQQAITRPSNDIKGIFSDLAGLLYIQTHVMPFERGSEAITRWVLDAVARHHNYEIIYPKNYGFQKPFHSTYDDFITDFVTTIRLQPLEQKTTNNTQATSNGTTLPVIAILLASAPAS